MNPVDWAEWVYGKWFVGHPWRGYLIIMGGVTVVIGAVFTAIWTRAVDAYNEKHPKASKEPELNEQLSKRDEELQIARAEILRLVRQLPPTNLPEDRVAKLTQRLKKSSPSVVTILYLDLPTARASQLAYSIAEGFKAAGWRVRLRPVVEGYESWTGVSQHVEDGRLMRPLQKVAHEALLAAKINVGTWQGGAHGFSDSELVGDYILFIVGRQ